MYRGGFCPTNPASCLELYDYSGDKKKYRGTTFKNIVDYLGDLFRVGFQSTYGDYSIYSNGQGLERHFLKLASVELPDSFPLNSFRMDFMYHNLVLGEVN